MRRHCLAPAAAFCMPMGMPGSTGSTARPITPGNNPPLRRGRMLEPCPPKSSMTLHQATASPIALEALERISALFAIESSIRGTTTRSACGRARNQCAQPLLEQLKGVPRHVAQPGERQECARPGDPLCPVALAGADPLCHRRPARSMSNNAAERTRAMKPPVLGRKNYLFCVAPTPGESAPPVSTPSSKPPRCAASIRRPIWPMSSTALLTTRSAKSTPCSPGAGQNSNACQGLPQTKGSGQRLTVTGDRPNHSHPPAAEIVIRGDNVHLTDHGH